MAGIIELLFNRISGQQTNASSIRTSMSWIKRILQKSPLKEQIMAIEVCDIRRIAMLNKKYRFKNRITDVLAFPFCRNENTMDTFDNVMNIYRNNAEKTMKKDVNFHKLTPMQNPLGVIVLCSKYLYKEDGRVDIVRLKKLIVHGICHIFGMDHGKEMRKREEKLLTNLRKIK